MRYFMTNALFFSRRQALRILLLALCLLARPALAFPPALPHTIYGLIRDEQGNPLTAGATIILESASGVKVYNVVSEQLAPDLNYRLSIPLDAGLIGAAYKTTALNPAAPFKIKVAVGTTIYLPIEMSHDFSQLGEPGKSTLLNLTLGVDSNDDGLPDAWQRRINQDLTKVTPNGDADGDGMSNLEEYLAGTYAFDPASGFTVAILRFNHDLPVLGFTSITGRNYTVLGATEVDGVWAPVQFRLATTAPEIPAMSSYSATDVRLVEIEVVSPVGQTAPSFFRLMLK